MDIGAWKLRRPSHPQQRGAGNPYAINTANLAGALTIDSIASAISLDSPLGLDSNGAVITVADMYDGDINNPATLAADLILNNAADNNPMMAVN